MPLSPAAEVDRAAKVAAIAFKEWRRTPAVERVQYLFKLKNLLEQNFDEIARIITNECGKTHKESLGEMRRAIENVEVACGVPSLMQGYNRYGNMACIFTTSEAVARRFRCEVQAGNLGVNIGVAAPMAFFPFCGWKDSFFCDLHGQDRQAIEFYAQTKLAIERWPA